MVKQTAGRDSLGDFAPKFAELNDDVLFGEVWSREDKLSLKMRSILTVTALVSKNRNGRDFNTSCFLCGLAERVVGISRCKRSVCR